MKEKTLWLRRPDLNQPFCQDVCASEGKAKAKKCRGPGLHHAYHRVLLIARRVTVNWQTLKDR